MTVNQEITKQVDNGTTKNRKDKPTDVRRMNVIDAKAVADSVRSSLGPRGMDKMIVDSKNDVIISNDGATILKQMNLKKAAGKMMVELSQAQDEAAGDGTTSVVVLAGAMLTAAERLLDKGIHPHRIAKTFLECAHKAEHILETISWKFELTDKQEFIRSATTSLHSKMVSYNAPLLSEIAVNSVLSLYEEGKEINIKDIRVVQRLGGTVEDTELINGIVFSQEKTVRGSIPINSIEKPKIGLIQFCLSPPKTDVESNITVQNYMTMDKLLREERLLMAKMVKTISATGCNVLLIQKSILRDATTALSLDYLNKSKILVIKDIERDEIEFLCKSLGCKPASSLDHFTSDRLGDADLAVVQNDGTGGRITKILGVKGKNTISILCRASNQLMLDETERSLHDALCVVKCLIRKRALVPGGGAAEIEISQKLNQWARGLGGEEQLCAMLYAEALQIIPSTLSDNAGCNTMEIIADLRKRHTEGESSAGINVRRGEVSDMLKENVVQPMFVTSSAIKLATETVMYIIRVDDMLMSR